MSGDVAVENTDGSMILVNILMSVKASSEEKAETAFENMDISFETLSDLLKVEVKGGSSGLSFLGIGVQPPTPSWGTMLAEGRDYMLMQWWLAAYPGLAIFMAALGINLMGDAMRDLMDPHLRKS